MRSGQQTSSTTNPVRHLRYLETKSPSLTAKTTFAFIHSPTSQIFRFYNSQIPTTPSFSLSSFHTHYESQTSCNYPQAYSVCPVVGSKSCAQSLRTAPCFQTIILKIVSTPYLLNMYNSLYQQKHLATSHVLITIHPAY